MSDRSLARRRVARRADRRSKPGAYATRQLRLNDPPFRHLGRHAAD